MKDLKKLTGAKQLSKMEQQAIKGGLACAWPDDWCPTNCCIGGLCRPTEQCL
jgi:hypothetical protein